MDRVALYQGEMVPVYKTHTISSFLQSFAYPVERGWVTSIQQDGNKIELAKVQPGVVLVQRGELITYYVVED